MDQPQNPYEAPREASVPDHEGQGGEEPPGSAFEAVNRRFFRLIGESGGPLIILWGVIALLNLPQQLMSVASQEALAVADFKTGFGLLVIFYPLSILVAALNFTSFRAVKMADETSGDITLMQAIDTTLSRVLPTVATLLLYGILVGVGSLFCLVPGIYASLVFLPAPFICAVYGYGPIESLKTARSWFHTHTMLFVVLIGAAILYGIVLAAIVLLLLNSVFQVNLLSPSGTLSLGYIPTTMVWLLTSSLGYFMWLYTGSVYITVGRAEEKFMRRYDLFEG